MADANYQNVLVVYGEEYAVLAAAAPEYQLTQFKANFNFLVCDGTARRVFLEFSHARQQPA